MTEVPARLNDIAIQVEAGNQPTTTVKELLLWFGASRRGHFMVQRIRKALEIKGIRTEPDFEGAYIEGTIRFLPAIALVAGNSNSSLAVKEPVALYRTDVRARKTIDPKFRISRLASANQQPVSVQADHEVAYATSLMLTNDYSQLPVMRGVRDVKGMVSWKSIGRRTALGKPPAHVRDCMERHHEVSATASLHEVIAQVNQHDCVLVRDATKAIVGIVTTADLGEQFGQLSEPFLLLSEIETRLRHLLDQHVSQAELLASLGDMRSARTIASAANLTFGEYQRLFERPEYWSRIGLQIDKAIFTANLERVRLIRNEVMHFDPDGLDESDLTVLRKFTRFFDMLEDVGLFEHGDPQT